MKNRHCEMILSIESSCDDSSIALTHIRSKTLLYHIKLSQDKEHSTYGGIVPEIASRLHCQRLPEILKTLKDALHGDLSVIKAIAVTTRPGLSVTLIEGLMMAKTLAMALSLPLICVNHLKGHIYSLFIATSQNPILNTSLNITNTSRYLSQNEILYHSYHLNNADLDSKSLESSPDSINAIDSIHTYLPLGILLVSGGHTQILYMRDEEHISLIASSLDDSFGESFDKVAKYLGLGYPGGPKIESYASAFMQNYPHKKPHHFPVPLLHQKTLSFSFSGLKNAVRIAANELEKPLNDKDIGSICAGFQKSACEHIARKVKLFFQSEVARDLAHFAIVGGASANLYLRDLLLTLSKTYNKKLLLAPLAFCADNAAMIGRAAIRQYEIGDFTPLSQAHISPKSLESDFTNLLP